MMRLKEKRKTSILQQSAVWTAAEGINTFFVLWINYCFIIHFIFTTFGTKNKKYNNMRTSRILILGFVSLLIVLCSNNQITVTSDSLIEIDNRHSSVSNESSSDIPLKNYSAEDREKVNSTDPKIMNSIGLIISIVTAISTIIVFFIQQSKFKSESFLRYAEHLHSDKESDRIASAVLLRYFIRKRAYRKRTINIITSLLRITPNGNLQKTLGDGLSYSHNHRGQDFQKVNLHNVLIKPQSYIKYKLCSYKSLKAFYKKSRIKYNGADFYLANLSELNANSVNFSGAHFIEANVCRAKFKNCIFENANFGYSNMDCTEFKDCILDGACFANAKRISSASIIGEHGVKTSLINHLDSEGYFHPTPYDSIQYIENQDNKHIFISKLGLMDSFQQMHYDRIIDYLKKNYHINPVYLDRNDYVDFGQLSTIKEKMSYCAGVVVFAFSYLNVTEAVLHKNLAYPQCELQKNCAYSSPWIQIETAFANTMGLPTMVILEPEVVHDGIFDERIIENDYKLFKITYNGGLTSQDKSVIDKWYNNVICCNSEK